MYHFMVLANGKVLQSGNRQLRVDETLDAQLSPLHAPLTTVLVYARMNDELLADSVTFNVDGILGNQVRVTSEKRYFE